jgi:hypothetical protein
MSENNKARNTFEGIEPVYQRADVEETPEGSVITLKAKIFRAYPSILASPIYIVDDKGIVHSRKSELPLVKMSVKDLDTAFERKEHEYIMHSLKSDPRLQAWSDLSELVFTTDYEFNDANLGQWVDIMTGEPTTEYKTLVANIIQYKAVKDPYLQAIIRACIPRGYVMKYQPHNLQITPPNTGKSISFGTIGKVVDKVTARTLLGGARWTNDKAYGELNDQYVSYAIDQVESQNIENIAGFLLSFLESGKVVVAGGGTSLTIRGACPLSILANPLGLQENRVSVLREYIALLCRNSYAIGRRFGILAYGNYAPIKVIEEDSDGYKVTIDTYRGLENRITRTLERFWAHPKIKDFCNQQVYDRTLYEKIVPCDVMEVRSFLLSHYAHAFPHIRGGAINMALVDNLPRLALLDILMVGDMDKIVDKIIEDAKPYVETLKGINIASIEYALS